MNDANGNQFHEKFRENDFTNIGNKVPMMNEKRCKVINELIATERDYLENLHVVKECFIYPMKQNNMLIEDEMEIIFINWNDLVLCTNRLYKSLKIRPPSCIVYFKLL